ncbi:hypothetical protein C8A01DRAFT_16453 [Parachaetomium inaequale]|uniref:Cyanovirin-N domain-containing protein n=1 Tax=Parachaetomium inaequale TaxID=2588326 RepID=A0AAN6PGG3_9PEZI|nr:hypothetical protein C8A01DRAFT_16453 [Parachaetomium inaequale]
MKATFLAAVLATLTAQATASYASSCRNCRLEQWSSDWLSGNNLAPMLLCDCAQKNGGWHALRLDLNLCIANDDGNLSPRANGNFGGSCNGFRLDGGKQFRCMCKGK